jgi:hydrogenase maturation protease
MRALVAGIGNIFFGDDGFGVEVVRRLAGEPLPAGIAVIDFGIRSVHLAFQLLEPVELLIVADCMARDGEPGTLYVLEPALDDDEADVLEGGHGMSLLAVFAQVRAMGGQLPPIRIVGCEPARIEAGIGLSPIVEAAIPAALRLIRDVIAAHPMTTPEETP